jgi:hypothetical protein
VAKEDNLLRETIWVMLKIFFVLIILFYVGSVVTKGYTDFSSEALERLGGILTTVIFPILIGIVIAEYLSKRFEKIHFWCPHCNMRTLHTHEKINIIRCERCNGTRVSPIFIWAYRVLVGLVFLVIIAVIILGLGH